VVGGKKSWWSFTTNKTDHQLPTFPKRTKPKKYSFLTLDKTKSHMKKTLFFLLIPLFSFAQQEGIPANKNEFGLNVFSMKRVQVYYDWDKDRNEVLSEMHILPGIYYKRHFGKNAFRGSFEFTRRKNTDRGSPWYFSKENNVIKKSVGISIGYERAFGKRKLQPFVFSDLQFTYENMAVSQVLQGYLGPNQIRHYVFENFEYAVAAGAGLRYKYNSKIYLTYECAVQGYRNVYQEVLRAGDKYWDLGYHVDPVSKLGIAISF
jgi:hypothetical protein